MPFFLNLLKNVPILSILPLLPLLDEGYLNFRSNGLRRNQKFNLSDGLHWDGKLLVDDEIFIIQMYFILSIFIFTQSNKTGSYNNLKV